MQHRFRTAVSRIASILGLVIVSSALIAPSANAAERKRATVKKVAPSATASTKKTADRRVPFPFVLPNARATTAGP